jgi:hypothetical protein
MRFRKLRIAWSVFWGLACVLLIVLWVRSYSLLTTKEVLVTRQFRYYLHSVDGTVAIQRSYRAFSSAEFMPIFRKSDMSWLTTNSGILIKRIPGYGIELVSFSCWFLTLCTISIGGVPWFRWRFSLRTMLIATALMAVVLGLIVLA